MWTKNLSRDKATEGKLCIVIHCRDIENVECDVEAGALSFFTHGERTTLAYLLHVYVEINNADFFASLYFSIKNVHLYKHVHCCTVGNIIMVIFDAYSMHGNQTNERNFSIASIKMMWFFYPLVKSSQYWPRMIIVGCEKCSHFRILLGAARTCLWNKLLCRSEHESCDF